MGFYRLPASPGMPLEVRQVSPWYVWPRTSPYTLLRNLSAGTHKPLTQPGDCPPPTPHPPKHAQVVVNPLGLETRQQVGAGLKFGAVMD